MSYAVIDTEGSGLFDFKKPADAPGQPRMAALGIILLNEKLEVEEKRSFLIKPEGWTFDDASEAAQKNGLTHDRLMAEGGDVRDSLRFVGAAIDERRVWVGFNTPHDLKTFRAECRHVGFPDRFMQTRYMCVMQGCRQVVDARTEDGKKKAPRLAEACAFFGIDQGTGAHTDMGDAESAYAILLRLRDMNFMPDLVDPYDKGKPKPKRMAPTEAPLLRPQGRAYEQQVIRDQQEEQQGDFLRGASEDGK